MKVLAPVLMLLILAAPQLAPAGDVCCLCVGCPTEPATCVAPTFDCAPFCLDLGCPGTTMGGGEQCAAAPECASTTTAPAPTVSQVGLGVMAAGLALVGAMRIARRRTAPR